MPAAVVAIEDQAGGLGSAAPRLGMQGALEMKKNAWPTHLGRELGRDKGRSRYKPHQRGTGDVQKLPDSSGVHPTQKGRVKGGGGSVWARSTQDPGFITASPSYRCLQGTVFERSAPNTPVTF